MIFSQIPLRVSFCGGGTDIPFFIKELGYGKVISTTINKYIYTYINKNQYNTSYFLKYSISENVKKSSEIKHNIIRHMVEKYNIGYCELGSIADIPSKSGLGSSSAFTASLLANIYEMNNITWNKASLAKDVCEIEIHELKERIGYQDAYSCIFGGLNQFIFHKDGRVEVEKIPLDKGTINDLESHMILIKTVMSQDRSASKILNDAQNNKNINAQIKILELVDQFSKALDNKDIKEMGAILNQNWEHKKSLSKDVSNNEIDIIYNKMMNYGAYGGKLLGAGGSGFLLMLMPKKKIVELTSHFPDIIIEPFQFDLNGLFVHNI